MKKSWVTAACAAVVLGLAAASVDASAETVKLGKIAFLAETNVKMFRFKGEAKELQAKISRSGNQLSALELRIPVNEIKTGMEIRDKHMRERVFTAADGSTPDVVFTASKSDCRPGGAASEQTCVLDGKLTIRGQERALPLTVSFKDGAKVSGHVEIDVLDFGVTPQALLYSGINVDKKASIDFEVSLQ